MIVNGNFYQTIANDAYKSENNTVEPLATHMNKKYASGHNHVGSG